jgi:integrase/recombinase XerD
MSDLSHGEQARVGEALGMRHEDIDIGDCLVHVVPRDNANGARAKSGRGRVIPASAPLMRLYADYLNREYQAVDSDYVFVGLWAAPAGRPLTYPAVYDPGDAAARGDRDRVLAALVPALV